MNEKPKTSVAQGEAQRPAPRLPHERDESADSQPQAHPAAQRVGRLAHDDVVHGVADTSRSVETDQTYHRLREGAPADTPEDEPGISPRARRASRR